MPLTDIALRKATSGQVLRENGLEFRFYEDGKAGVRFVGRVRGTNGRVGVMICPLQSGPSTILVWTLKEKTNGQETRA